MIIPGEMACVDKAFQYYKRIKICKFFKRWKLQISRNEKNEEFAMSENPLLCTPCSFFENKKTLKICYNHNKN